MKLAPLSIMLKSSSKYHVYVYNGRFHKPRPDHHERHNKDAGNTDPPRRESP